VVAEGLVTSISQLKHTAIGGVFFHFFNALNAGTKKEPFKFNLRPDTTVFFVPAADRVTVLFTVDFKEKVDRAVARVFMQVRGLPPFAVVGLWHSCVLIVELCGDLSRDCVLCDMCGV
jgi:hypothetical protein